MIWNFMSSLEWKRYKKRTGRSAVCCLEAILWLTIVWLLSRFPQNAFMSNLKQKPNDVYFPIYYFFSDMCKHAIKVERGFFRHNMTTRIAVQAEKQWKCLMFPWESRPPLDVIDKVFSPSRFMRNFNWQRAQKTEGREDGCEKSFKGFTRSCEASIKVADKFLSN